MDFAIVLALEIIAWGAALLIPVSFLVSLVLFTFKRTRYMVSFFYLLIVDFLLAWVAYSCVFVLAEIGLSGMGIASFDDPAFLSALDNGHAYMGYARPIETSLVFECIGRGFYQAFAGFLVQNGPDTLENAALFTYGWDNAYIAFNPGAATTFSIFLLYVGSIVQFFAAAAAIVRRILRSYGAWVRNLVSGLKGIGKRFSLDPRKECYKTVVYTDLPLSEIEYFVDALLEDQRMILHVVTSEEESDEGSELASALRLKGVRVYQENVLDPHTLRKHCHNRLGRLLPFLLGRINVYSLYYGDRDNKAFADMALSFLNSNAWARKDVENRLLRFYVAHQDEPVFQSVDYEKSSKGGIQLINEYDWAASRYIFLNPLSKISAKPAYVSRNHNPLPGDEDIELSVYGRNEEREVPTLHVYFLGFGNISMTMFDKMLSHYVYGDAKTSMEKVVYHVYGQPSGRASSYPFEMPEGVDEALAPYRASFSARKGDYNDLLEMDVREPSIDRKPSSDGILHGRNGMIDFAVVDLESDGDLHKVARSIYLAETLGTAAQAIAVVSLGSSERNLTVATRLRRFFREEINAGNWKIDEAVASSNKELVIFPYFRETLFGSPDLSLYRELICAHMKDDLDLRRKGECKSPVYAVGMDESVESYLTRLSQDYKKVSDIESKALFLINDDPSFDLDNIPGIKRLRKKARDYLKNVGKLPNSGDVDSKLYFSNITSSKVDAYLRRQYFSLAEAFRRKAKVPIVGFGRGGYIRDSFSTSIEELAAFCNWSYGNPTVSPKLSRKFADARPFDTLKDVFSDYDGLSWQYKLSNIEAALTLPNRLAHYGLMLSLTGRDYATYGEKKATMEERKSYHSSISKYEKACKKLADKVKARETELERMEQEAKDLEKELERAKEPDEAGKIDTERVKEITERREIAIERVKERAEAREKERKEEIAEGQKIEIARMKEIAEHERTFLGGTNAIDSPSHLANALEELSDNFSEAIDARLEPYFVRIFQDDGFLIDEKGDAKENNLKALEKSKQESESKVKEELSKIVDEEMRPYLYSYEDGPYKEDHKAFKTFNSLIRKNGLLPYIRGQSPEQMGLCSIEHRRWATYQALDGWLPADKNSTTDLFKSFKTKDVDRSIHSCLVSDEGLDEMGECFREAFPDHASYLAYPFDPKDAKAHRHNIEKKLGVYLENGCGMFTHASFYKRVNLAKALELERLLLGVLSDSTPEIDQKDVIIKELQDANGNELELIKKTFGLSKLSEAELKELYVELEELDIASSLDTRPTFYLALSLLLNDVTVVGYEAKTAIYNDLSALTELDARLRHSTVEPSGFYIERMP